MDKLRSWRRIPDGNGKAIREFFVFLVKCQGCLNDSEYLNGVNTSSMLKTVYIKLPERLQRKWVSLAHRIETVNLRRPSFSDFVTFVENKSDIANNPTYSKEAFTNIASKAKCSERYPNRGMKQKVSSFGTKAKNDDSVPQRLRNFTPCPSCSLDHDLDSCKQFLCKNPCGRKMFVMSKRLCFACYAPDHNIKSCPKKRMCQKEGCGDDYPTGLHESFKLKSKDTSKSEHERSDGKSDLKAETKRVDNGFTNLDDLSCNLSECYGDFMSMSIVPLVLFHKDRHERKIKVYDMLDNCSQGTFIRNDILGVSRYQCCPDYNYSQNYVRILHRKVLCN